MSHSLNYAMVVAMKHSVTSSVIALPGMLLAGLPNPATAGFLTKEPGGNVVRYRVTPTDHKS